MNTMSAINPLHTIADWRRAYDDGAQPLALLQALAARLAPGDTAWIHRCDADHIARQVAALPPRSAATPLWGVPFAVKDNIDVHGLPTTAACPAFAYAPARTATVVQRLEAAGAVLLGKTNLDQFATGLVGTRSPYGSVPNTFDPAYVAEMRGIARSSPIPALVGVVFALFMVYVPTIIDSIMTAVI